MRRPKWKGKVKEDVEKIKSGEDLKRLEGILSLEKDN